MVLICLYDAIYARMRPRLRRKRKPKVVKVVWTKAMIRDFIVTKLKDLATGKCLQKDHRHDKDSGTDSTETTSADVESAEGDDISNDDDEVEKDDSQNDGSPQKTFY